MMSVDTLMGEFHSKMDWLQFERDYDKCKFLIVDQDVHGFGGQLGRRIIGLQLGYIFDRTVVFCRPNDPPYVTCYQPTGKYTYDDVKHLPKGILDLTSEQEDDVLYFDFAAFWTNEKLKSWFFNWVPPEFKKHGYGRVFFDGQISTRFKLLDEFRDNIEKAKVRMGFENPIIGVHIRRGDKYTEAPYIPLRVTLDKIKRLSNETGIRRVLVNSDSEEILNKLPRNIGLDFIYDAQEKRYNNANHRFLKENPQLAKQETLTATKIIELLASCDWIVGPNNTHFTLIAEALNCARTLNSDRSRYVDGNYLTFSVAPLWHWHLVLLEKLRAQMSRLLRITRASRKKLGFTRTQLKLRYRNRER